MRRLLPWLLVGLVGAGGAIGAALGITGHAGSPDTTPAQWVADVMSATKAAGTARVQYAEVTTSANPDLRGSATGSGVIGFSAQAVHVTEVDDQPEWSVGARRRDPPDPHGDQGGDHRDRHDALPELRSRRPRARGRRERAGRSSRCRATTGGLGLASASGAAALLALTGPVTRAQRPRPRPRLRRRRGHDALPGAHRSPVELPPAARESRRRRSRAPRCGSTAGGAWCRPATPSSTAGRSRPRCRRCHPQLAVRPIGLVHHDLHRAPLRLRRARCTSFPRRPSNRTPARPSHRHGALRLLGPPPGGTGDASRWSPPIRRRRCDGAAPNPGGGSDRCTRSGSAPGSPGAPAPPPRTAPPAPPR